jgi:hypothetical protein
VTEKESVGEPDECAVGSTEIPYMYREDVVEVLREAAHGSSYAGWPSTVSAHHGRPLRDVIGALDEYDDWLMEAVRAGYVPTPESLVVGTIAVSMEVSSDSDVLCPTTVTELGESEEILARYAERLHEVAETALYFAAHLDAQRVALLRRGTREYESDWRELGPTRDWMPRSVREEAAISELRRTDDLYRTVVEAGALRRRTLAASMLSHRTDGGMG